jgi:hypothetical protein
MTIGLLLTAFTLINITLINIPLAIAWFDVKFYEKWEKAIEHLCEFDFIFCVSLILFAGFFPETASFLIIEI